MGSGLWLRFAKHMTPTPSFSDERGGEIGFMARSLTQIPVKTTSYFGANTPKIFASFVLMSLLMVVTFRSLHMFFEQGTYGRGHKVMGAEGGAESEPCGPAVSLLATCPGAAGTARVLCLESPERGVT